MKRDIVVIAVSAAVLAVMLAVIFMLQDIIEPRAPTTCNATSDCTGSCAGSWECVNSGCSCKTSSTPTGACETSQDCEGLIHIMCVGQWFCEAGKCEWYCEVEQDRPKSDSNKASDSVLFVEQHTSTDGKLIGGSYPFMFIDFPTYHFSEETRTLSGRIDFDVNKSVVIYGSGQSLSGDAGSGTAIRLYSIESVPGRVGEDTIARIWEDGTVAINHKNHTITLALGEEWTETTTEEKTNEFNSGLMRLTSTDRIKNYGFIERANIEVGL